MCVLLGREGEGRGAVGLQEPSWSGPSSLGWCFMDQVTCTDSMSEQHSSWGEYRTEEKRFQRLKKTCSLWAPAAYCRGVMGSALSFAVKGDVTLQ